MAAVDVINDGFLFRMSIFKLTLLMWQHFTLVYFIGFSMKARKCMSHGEMQVNISNADTQNNLFHIRMGTKNRDEK